MMCSAPSDPPTPIASVEQIASSRDRYLIPPPRASGSGLGIGVMGVGIRSRGQA